ncbi:hypothetical protein AVEN_39939-1 [Araneus ventricosus]|uniref:Uncharacterized protein n=1 Tax=Araneus ventricosus TaxID=182803 RepID=A0A4Y2WMX1_ARAVE|nr:hypothetical protein AVEN_191895-1 [Araneus ventricosus]GBO37954.1 hypothetical protein AVEN_246638-1 [Araneus ventricosus]GBO37955.1 hypothetical protein AVEN_18619-1 [Araneus ventricosus]GBO37959.1 hypothetical protein AVEN_39939-1 [Araneus ventricosus]
MVYRVGCVSARKRTRYSLAADFALHPHSPPQLDQVQESARPQKTIGERLMVKEESAASDDLGRPREEV